MINRSNSTIDLIHSKYETFKANQSRDLEHWKHKLQMQKE